MKLRTAIDDVDATCTVACHYIPATAGIESVGHVRDQVKYIIARGDPTDSLNGDKFY